MRDGAFQDWRRERDAVEQEMDRLIAAGCPASVDVAALAPDAAAFLPESASLFPHSVAVPAAAPPATHPPDAVANTTDAAPLTADAKAPSVLSSDDPPSDASLLTLLRRMQSNIEPGGQRTVVD
jgi:hypothetical protein